MSHLDDNLDDMICELEHAASLACNEETEYWAALCKLAHLRINYVDRFGRELESEIRAEYQHFKENYEIFEEEVTKTFVEQRLQHVDD